MNFVGFVVVVDFGYDYCKPLDLALEIYFDPDILGSESES